MLKFTEQTLPYFFSVNEFVGKAYKRAWERQVNEQGAGCLTVCVTSLKCTYARRLLFVYRTRQLMLSLTHFHNETLPAGQYKYHECGVRHQHQLPSSLPVHTSGIPQTSLSLKRSCYGTSGSPYSVHAMSLSDCIRLV